MYSDSAYFGNVIMYGKDLGARVIELGSGWAFGKNRVYETVNIFKDAVRADLFDNAFW